MDVLWYDSDRLQWGNDLCKPVLRIFGQNGPDPDHLTRLYSNTLDQKTLFCQFFYDKDLKYENTRLMSFGKVSIILRKLKPNRKYFKLHGAPLVHVWVRLQESLVALPLFLPKRNKKLSGWCILSEQNVTHLWWIVCTVLYSICTVHSTAE